jgi:prepilin-type N-terminal cleavage/methylation domain-containing protein
MDHRARSPSAFTLLEVLLAVAVFAGAIVIILSMLPGLTRQGSASLSGLNAQRLSDAVTLELQRLANGNLDALAARIPVMTAPLREGFPLVAARQATRVASISYRPPVAAEQSEEADLCASCLAVSRAGWGGRGRRHNR